MSEGRAFLRVARYAWALPNTILGALLIAGGAVSGSRVAVVSGVLEAQGGGIAFFLRRLVPLRGGASAMTLGHVVVGRDPGSLERTRAHERAHVRQYEQWGPLFVPVYFGASVLAALRGRHYYRDNWFEKEAVAAADKARSTSRTVSL